jgi:hypothetical protein
MASVFFDESDLDSNRRIENAIRRNFSRRLSAVVPTAVITNQYGLQRYGRAISSTLEEKCDAIAKIFDAEIFVTGDVVVFIKRAHQ